MVGGDLALHGGRERHGNLSFSPAFVAKRFWATHCRHRKSFVSLRLQGWMSRHLSLEGDKCRKVHHYVAGFGNAEWTPRHLASSMNFAFCAHQRGAPLTRRKSLSLRRSARDFLLGVCRGKRELSDAFGRGNFAFFACAFWAAKRRKSRKRCAVRQRHVALHLVNYQRAG